MATCMALLCYMKDKESDELATTVINIIYKMFLEAKAKGI